MGKCFSSHILHFKDGASPVLTTSPLPLHPAASTPPELPVANAALISGFAALFPETSLPVSPTLQLNADLTDCSQKRLTAIGMAELRRHLSVKFASYVQEPDARVAVVAKSLPALHEVMDHYGAVLHIEPILTRDFAPGIPTAEDITVSTTSQGLRLSFLSRAPVDLERCTYCGACGPVCPEQCLHPDLFLDLANCSLCMQCEQACPVQAIDLHARARHTLQVPALIDLDGIFQKRSDTSTCIFSREQVADFLALLHPCQIEETVVCETASCQYVGAFAKGCDRCFQVCGHGAVQKNEDGIRVDAFGCTECGKCMAACPTGAMQFLRFTDHAFVEYLRDIDLSPGTTVVIGAEPTLHRLWWQYRDQQWRTVLFLEFPEPGALHNLHLLLLLALGAARIFVCHDRETDTLNKCINQVNTLLQSLFGDHKPVRAIGLNEVGDLLATPAATPLASQYRDYSFTSRRDKIVSLLIYFMEQGARITPDQAALFDDFGAIACDTEKCSLCLACVGQCHTGALRADSEQFCIMFNAALCVQCGACAELCPEQALTLTPGLRLEPDFFQATPLIQAEPMRCADCGKVFGTRQSFARVMELLGQSGREVDQELFSRCEDCRVIRLHGGTDHA